MLDPDSALPDISGTAYGFDGESISIEEWGLLLVDPRGRVGHAHIGPVLVATDWFGIDSGGRRPPHIYETMIFPRRNRDSNAGWANMRWRYPTREAALAGHIRLVNRLRARGVEVLLDRRRDDDFRRILMGLLAIANGDWR